MWNIIKNETDLNCFMEKVEYFHDSCIKELKYVSGSYVDDNLSMYPINDKRSLNVIIQCQIEDIFIVELQFLGLQFLKLCPCDENYTSEILDSMMFFKDEYICWCDFRVESENKVLDYNGTIICALEVRWRTIKK